MRQQLRNHVRDCLALPRPGRPKEDEILVPASPRPRLRSATIRRKRQEQVARMDLVVEPPLVSGSSAPSPSFSLGVSIKCRTTGSRSGPVNQVLPHQVFGKREFCCGSKPFTSFRYARAIHQILRTSKSGIVGLRLGRLVDGLSAYSLRFGHGSWWFTSFVGYWRPVSQAQMQPYRIVPALDVAEAGQEPGFGLGTRRRLSGSASRVEKKLSAMALLVHQPEDRRRFHRPIPSRANTGLAAPAPECH